MTKLKKCEIEYDPNLVCSECNKNEFIHYNYTCFHGGEATRDDEFESVDQPGVWCSSCTMEVEMVEQKNTPTFLIPIFSFTHTLRTMKKYRSRIGLNQLELGSMN